ncbi:MAG: response regulator [Myxococcales bacterium]|nr:response regulator [Myxococcales bacterium]
MSSGGPLWNSSRIREGLRDFFSVYNRVVDDVQRRAERELEHHPMLGPVFRGFSEEQREQQRQTSRERMKRVEAGDWESYQEHLRNQGAFYAFMSVRFSDWYDVTRVLQRGMTEHLIAALSHEPSRLAAALEAMSLFYDRALGEIADSFIAAKERAVRQESEKLTAVIASLHEAVVFVDTEGKVILRNPASVALSRGDTASDIRDPKVGERYFREGANAPMAVDELPVARALRGETVVDELIERRTPDAPPVFLSVNAAPLTSEDGTRFGAVASYRDVSVRRELEAERLRSSEVELRGRHALEASRLKSEFLANMSHELRTPLNSIIGFAELLFDGEAGPLAEQQQEFVRDILKSGQHLLQLINDVLDLSKVEAGRMEFYSENTRLSAIVDEVCSMLRNAASTKHIAVRVDAADEVDESFLDPARFKQVLFNFVSNALKFTPSGGSVVVRTRAEGAQHFRLEVEDTGVGIAAEDLDRLFVEFQQLGGGAAKLHGGTGLGLALTRRLVESQGGSIGVRSELGRGSTFYVVLPRRIEASAHRPDAPMTTSSHAPRLPKVLVVEDDPASLRLMAATLEYAGLSSVCFTDPQSALSHARSEPVSAIILDLHMPALDGFAFLRALRSDPKCTTIPVIVWSVLELTKEQLAELQRMAQRVLRKDGVTASILRELEQLFPRDRP